MMHSIQDMLIVFRRLHDSRITSAISQLPQRTVFNWLQQKQDNSGRQEQPAHKMVDPKRVVSYEDMLKVIHEPAKVIIDVRNPDEVDKTGQIPSSINIPLNHVQNVLTSMSDEDFQRQFKRDKPRSSDELIFYCQSGRRSSEALDKALKLGYSNSKTYLGSWNDWSSKYSK